MNLFVATGRVGAKDAVVRYTAAQTPVTSFSLAVDSGFGEKKQTLWLDCSAWGERHTGVAAHILRGKQVSVHGELGRREYEGKTYLTLNVQSITLCGSAPQAAAPAPAPAAAKAPAKSKSKALRVEALAEDEIPF